MNQQQQQQQLVMASYYPSYLSLSSQRQLCRSLVLATTCYYSIYITNSYLCVCVCVFFPFILDIKFVGRIPAGVTQEEGHTRFLVNFPSAGACLIFSRETRIQPLFLSLVDLEVESLVGHFKFKFFIFLVRKIPFTGDRTHVPTCQRVTRLLLSFRGYLHHKITSLV